MYHTSYRLPFLPPTQCCDIYAVFNAHFFFLIIPFLILSSFLRFFFNLYLLSFFSSLLSSSFHSFPPFFPPLFPSIFRLSPFSVFFFSLRHLVLPLGKRNIHIFFLFTIFRCLLHWGPEPDLHVVLQVC
jgi:hypothetical protein